MRFDFEALRQGLAARLSTKSSISPATLFAGGGVILAALVVFYGALIGTDAPEDAVTVSGPVFTPVATTAAPAPAPAAKPSSASAYAAPRFDDAASVTRAVQAELKRAECYSGPVNGVWNASTRAAMGEFTARVNARLPIDRPDPVLLALLETHNKISCTADCSMGGEDDCVPREALPPKRSAEVASIERERPGNVREEPRPGESSYATSATAEDLGFDNRSQRAPNPLATMQTASTGRDDGLGIEGAAAMGAAGAAAHETKQKPRRAARKYKRQPSLSRQVSKGFRQIQRSFNKLF